MKMRLLLCLPIFISVNLAAQEYIREIPNSTEEVKSATVCSKISNKCYNYNKLKIYEKWIIEVSERSTTNIELYNNRYLFCLKYPDYPKCIDNEPSPKVYKHSYDFSEYHRFARKHGFNSLTRTPAHIKLNKSDECETMEHLKQVSCKNPVDYIFDQKLPDPFFLSVEKANTGQLLSNSGFSGYSINVDPENQCDKVIDNNFRVFKFSAEALKLCVNLIDQANSSCTEKTIRLAKGTENFISLVAPPIQPDETCTDPRDVSNCKLRSDVQKQIEPYRKIKKLPESCTNFQLEKYKSMVDHIN